MNHIKGYLEYITELRKITSNISKSGSTKEMDWIYDDPQDNKSLSSSILLRQQLKEKELEDSGLPIQFSKYPKSKIDKFKITLNNLKFLKDKQEEGDLFCEYCHKGPLVIYDITGEPNFKKRINSNFNKNNGATTDHKTPLSKGGDKFGYDNLAVCCYRCNQRKRNLNYKDWINLINKTNNS